MRDGTFEEILVVRAVVAAGTSLIGSCIDGERAFVIELEGTAVQMLVVADKLFVYFHFGNHAVFVPCRTCYHPAERASGVACQRQVIGGFGFQVQISPQDVEDEAMALDIRFALVFVGQVAVFVEAGGQHGGQRIGGRVLSDRVSVAGGHYLSVRAAAIQEVVQHELLCRVVYGSCSHALQDPEGEEVIAETYVHVACPLMIVMSGIDVVPYRQVILEHHLYHVVVHVRIFVIDGYAGRKHVSQYHPFAGVSGNRFVVAWRVATFHRLGYADERFHVRFFLRFFHLVVAPVIYHCAAGEHHTTGA